MSMRVLLTGGTGFIGREIVFKLIERGDIPVIVTRNAGSTKEMFGSKVEVESWDSLRSGDALFKVEKVINLAGAPIAGKRWTEGYKNEVYESRVTTTRSLVVAMGLAEKPPSALVSASAVGYYGSSERPGFSESSPPGDDFLAKLCVDWEIEAQKAAGFGSRVAIIRSGVALGPGAGALSKIADNFHRHIGGTVGSGDQWVSWIDIEDLVNLYMYALDNDDVSGTLNGTSPAPVKMRTLTDKVGEILGRKSWIDAPPFVLKMLFKEGADVLLEGQHVLPKRTIEQGFDIQNRSLEQTLRKYL
ncbi:MAG: TIGR01777 family oxidoreductase [Candidatus Alcyoniella australis]|nr:TIGR01777 family oxidoreductase [Candidatus Alcyoniella australis]